MNLTKVLVIIGSVVVASGIVLFLVRGLSPKPVRVLNPTYFDDEGHLGRVLARRFFVDFKSAEVVVFGSSAHLKNYDVIWHELLKAAIADGASFDQIYTLEGLRPLSGRDQIITRMAEIQAQPGQKIIVHVPSDEHWWSVVAEAFPQSRHLFFQVPYQLLSEKSEDNPLPCDRSVQDLQFGCAAREASIRYYRKKLKEDRFAAMMEKYSANLHLLFVSEPAP